jgi:CelD/BcsL family acetyltransferase involved in cellulose biosynthesis
MSIAVPNHDQISNKHVELQIVNQDIRANIHNGATGLNRLRKQWEGLHEFCDLWARFEWYFAYLTNLAADSENIYFIEIIVGQETVAIIPAEISSQKIHPFGSLKVLGLAYHSHIPLTDFPLSLHIDHAKVAEQILKIFKEVPTQWDVMRWSHIMDSSNAMRVARLIRGCSTHIRQDSLCNYIETKSTYEQLSCVSTKIRSNLRKNRKQLSKIGNWKVTTSESATDFHPYYEEFLNVEASGWKGDSGTSSAIKLNSNIRNFYSTLLEQRSADFVPRVTLLISESKPVSGQFTVYTQGCVNVLKICYDENYSKVSPGQILIEELLISACASTYIEKMSFVTDMTWQHRWKPKQDVTYDVLIFRRPSLGMVFGWYLTVRRLVKSVITKYRR